MPKSNPVCWEENDRLRTLFLHDIKIGKQSRCAPEPFEAKPNGQPRETDWKRKQPPWTTNSGREMKTQTERYGLAKPLTVTSKPLDFSLKGASLLLGRWPRHFHHVFALRNPSSPLGDEGLMHAQSAKRLTFTKGDSTPFTSRSSRVRDSTSALHGFGISSRPGSNADSHQPRSSFKRG